MKPSEVAEKFDIPGRLIYVNMINRGNVNDTYEAAFRAGAQVERVVLQRINRNVFPKPEWIMENMRAVTDHVCHEIDCEHNKANREWGFPKVIPLRDGGDYFTDERGGFWRAITMIESATSFAEVQSPEHAMEAGMVLGCFHRMISDIDTESLHDTLPGFHICPEYLAAYDKTLVEKNGSGRLVGGEEQRLRDFIEERRASASVLEDALAKGLLQTQPIHGDPKVDNIMIDDFTGRGIGMVDLDTVKPGLIHYDFGDALRSVCNPAGEDTTDLREVVFDLGLCKAFVKGYLREAGTFLSDADRHYLYDSVRLLAFELGLRFFRDYLAGDVYFKVRFEEHNLNRARVQFKLCESIEANEEDIREVL